MNKIAVVTGTSQGLGLLLAHSLLDAGWTVYGLARSERSPILSSDKYNHVCLDISNKDAVQQFFATLPTNIDLLINNAAVFKLASLLNTEANDIDLIINTNVKGAMYCTKFSQYRMNRGGRIIFINSVAGLAEQENQAVYCASKYALTAFAGVIAKEFRDNEVSVTSIHPGGIKTPLWNETNPYPPGDVNRALDTREIARAVHFIIDAPIGVEYKTIKLFPSIENH